MKSGRTRKFLATVAPLILASLLLSSVSPAFATSPGVQQVFYGSSPFTTNVSASSGVNVGSGDLLVALVHGWWSNPSCTGAPTASMSFNTGSGSSVTTVPGAANYEDGSGYCEIQYGFYATASATEAVTLKVTWTQTMFSDGLIVIDAFGYSNAVGNTATGTCTSGCTTSASTASLSFGTSALVVVALGGVAATTCTAGTGFTVMGNLVGPAVGCGEYATSGVSSPTLAPMTFGTGGANTWQELSMEFELTSITVTCTTAEAGASQPTLSVTNATPTTLPCDGSPTTLTLTSSPVTLTVPVDGATQRDRIGSGYATSINVGAASSITVHVQELLTLSNCNGPSVSPSSPTSDSWYNYGTSLTTVNCNGVWSRSGGTGTRAISYNWNGGSNTAVSTTVTFNAGPETMSSGETLNVNPATQYFVTLDTAATSALSACHPTITGDACWYDSGATANVDLLGAYGRSTATGAGHRLTSWQLDSGSVNALLTSSTFTISVGSIAAPHTIQTTSATQYFVTPGSGLTLSSATISAGDTGWYDANSQVTAQGVYPVIYVVSSPLWVSQFSSVGMQLTTNGTASTVTYGSLVLTFNCAKCAAQLFVPSSSGLNVQTVTDDGKNVRFAVQGGVASFSGSSAWTVYFGQTVVQQGTTTTITGSTTSTTQGGGGIWQNLNSDWLYLAVAGVIAALGFGFAFALTGKRKNRTLGGLKKLEGKL